MQPSQTSQRAAIGVMGEFSVGKSTMCNLILGTRDLPEMITATQLPPVWFTKGPAQDTLVLKDGQTRVLDNGFDPENDLKDASHLLLHRDFPILDVADIVDFPGISDPNMDASVWQRLLPKMDAVLWLTHATQAWRQSEAAVWNTVSKSVKDQSALVVTQIDKITSESDKSRILKRLEFEAGDLFSNILPVSLNEAIRAGDDQDALAASGAVELREFLMGFEGMVARNADVPVEIEEPAQETPAAAQATPDAVAPEADAPRDDTRLSLRIDRATRPGRPKVADPVGAADDEAANPQEQTAETDLDMSGRILPRRVKPSGKTRRPRLQKARDDLSPLDRLEAATAQV